MHTALLRNTAGTFIFEELRCVARHPPINDVEVFIPSEGSQSAESSKQKVEEET